MRADEVKSDIVHLSSDVFMYFIIKIMARAPSICVKAYIVLILPILVYDEVVQCGSPRLQIKLWRICECPVSALCVLT